MTLKELLTTRLPQYLVGPNGKITTYQIGEEIGYRQQSVAEWFRKDRISIQCISLLLGLDGNTLKLSDFSPFCPELAMVLGMMENEKSKAEENEN